MIVNTGKCGLMLSTSEKMQRLKSVLSQVSAGQPAVPRISGFGCHGKVVSFLQSSEVCGFCGSVVVSWWYHLSSLQMSLVLVVVLTETGIIRLIAVFTECGSLDSAKDRKHQLLSFHLHVILVVVPEGKYQLLNL